MKDWILILIIAIFVIIGYLVMGLIDRSIRRHTTEDDHPGPKKEEDNHAETGESGRPHPGMPFFVHLQR